MNMGRPIIKDLTGRKFGRLTVLEPLPERQYGQTVWLCRCECGRNAKVSRKNLVSGNTRSCGCLKGRQLEKDSEKEVSESTPYPANEDCAGYDPERGECRTLTELLCATRGTCSFFSPQGGCGIRKAAEPPTAVRQPGDTP